MSGLERIREVQLDERYSVREDGTVLSNGMALSPVRGVWVSLHGERRYVSYLVARAFVPNPEGRPFVVHKDGNPENNVADNLEWSEEKEPDRRAGPKPRAFLFGQFEPDGTMVNRWGSVKEAAAATGLAPQAIRAALGRRNGKSGKWYWMYL
jgi:hypothetical protein